MKAVNFALVALASLGLVTSQVAFADTMPGAAVPAAPAAGKLHPVKLVRFAEKRHAGDSSALALVPVAFGLVALGGITTAVVEVSKSDKIVPIPVGSTRN